MDTQKTFTWNLHSRISRLLQKRSSSDVKFQVGSPPRQFFCHKVILAAGSPVFETMFFGTIRQKSPVCVPDLTAQGFAILLQYLYSDRVTLKDDGEAFEAAYAAKKYMVKSLFSHCEGFLLKNYHLTPENVFDAYEEASVLEMARLQSRCLWYISRNAKTVLRSESFRKVSKDTFQDILGLDLMNIDTEVEIVEALWSWGKAQCQENDEDSSIKNVRKHTKELLRYVRFFTLEEDELTNVLRKFQVMGLSEEMPLLGCLPKERMSETLPWNISMKSKKRSILNSTRVELPVEYRYDGNLGAFLLGPYKSTVDVAVTGTSVTIVGAVVAFKTIPSYSRPDRFLDVDLTVTNHSSKFSVKRHFKSESSEEGEKQHLLLLDDYILVEEQRPVSLTVAATGEGVRVMQCTKDQTCRRVGKSELSLQFVRNDDERNVFMPIKELMVV